MRRRRQLRADHDAATEAATEAADPASGPRDAVPPDQEFALVAVDPLSGAHIDIGIRASFRDLEILGSAGRYYGEHYDNPSRPPEQVAWRRSQASRLGEALWEAATDRVGIQDPTAEPG